MSAMRRWIYMLNKEFHLINCLNVIQCVQWPNVAAPTLTRRWHCAFVKMILHKLIWQVFVSYSTFILSTSFLKYIYVCMWLIEWIYWLFHISHNLNQVLLCDYSVLSICHWHIVTWWAGNTNSVTNRWIFWNLKIWNKIPLNILSIHIVSFLKTN